MVTVAEESPPSSRPARASAIEPRAERRDPFGPIQALGRREMRIGIALGLLGALLAHGALAARGLSALIDLQNFAALVQEDVAERLRTTIDIDVPPPPPPPPAPEPEATAPAPEPTTPPPPPENTPPPKETPPPAPAAAQAGKVLTAEPDPDAPVDLTDQGFVTGNGDRYAGGTTATNGTSQTAVRNPNARAGGTPGGTGTAPSQAPPPPAKDLSRPARPNSYELELRLSGGSRHGPDRLRRRAGGRHGHGRRPRPLGQRAQRPRPRLRSPGPPMRVPADVHGGNRLATASRSRAPRPRSPFASRDRAEASASPKALGRAHSFRVECRAACRRVSSSWAGSTSSRA